jgi:hypothetical protein
VHISSSPRVPQISKKKMENSPEKALAAQPNAATPWEHFKTTWMFLNPRQVPHLNRSRLKIKNTQVQATDCSISTKIVALNHIWRKIDLVETSHLKCTSTLFLSTRCQISTQLVAKNWTKRSCKESSRLNELDLARRLQAILTVNHTIILSPNQMGPLSVVWTQELPTVLHRRNSWLNNPMLRPNTLQVSSLHQTFYLLKVKKWVKRVLS